MHATTLLSWAAALATTQATYAGFNYGNTFTDGSAKASSDFEAEFKAAQTLAGTNGEFTSARLYTMIQGGTTNTPISAIQAAIDTKTSLLLGLWASEDAATFQNEVTALTTAISQYGESFTSLIAGISVGSEDLYRNSEVGIAADGAAVGQQPSVLVEYIQQVRSAIAGTKASGALVGHVDTWTAWVNSTNDDVIDNCDFLGVDAYPYFQNTMSNGIAEGKSLFFQAYNNTVDASNGKPVWITETGWPVSGPTENDAVASIANAKTYWDDVACDVLGNINTWWYTLQDAEPTTPSPSFGILGSDLDSAPLYDLTCSASSSSSSSSASATSSSTVASSASSSGTGAAAGKTTSTAASVSAASSKASASGSAASSSAVSEVTSVKTSATPVTGAGKTYTTKVTSVVTITSCTGGCSTEVVTISPSAGETTTVTFGASCSSSASAVSSASLVSSSAVSSASPVTSSASVGTASPSPATSSATTAASPSGSSCPTNLNGEYQYPHLIIPVSSASPSKAYGTQYNGTITPTVSTIFNFDIPESYSGETCSLVFLFPELDQLETSSWSFNGKGGLTVNQLSSPATTSTTYNSIPSVKTSDIGSVSSLTAGNGYVITTGSCAAGQTVSYEFVSTGGLDLEFFEDWNPSPLGAFITVC